MAIRECIITYDDEGQKDINGGFPIKSKRDLVRCRNCKHKKLDSPSLNASIVIEFYCDARAEWHYQYEGEPDIMNWFCADGERIDAPTCGPDYCEIGGENND